LNCSIGNPIVADWNGDGLLDLGATIYEGTTELGVRDGVAFRVNDLTVGTVETASISERFLGTGTSNGVQLDDAGDLDGDGYADALFQERREDNSGRLAVLSGPFSGDVEFSDAAYSIYGEPDYPVAQIDSRVADVDGDGIPEILAAGYSTLGGTTYGVGALSVYPGTGSGDHDASEAKAWVGCATEDDCWGFAWSLAVADNNGDGIDDVWTAAYAANDYAGRVYVFEGPFEGGRTEADADVLRTGDPGSMYGEAMTVADVDGDGDVDLAVLAGSDDSYQENAAAVYVESGPLLGANQAPTAASVAIRGDAEHRLGWLGGGDVDGDGRTDLTLSVLESDYRGDLYIWRGLSAGEFDFRDGSVVVSGVHAFDDVYPLSVRDIDGNGMADVVLRFKSGEQTAWGLFYNLTIQ
jgi:hypothetical protein